MKVRPSFCKVDQNNFAENAGKMVFQDFVIPVSLLLSLMNIIGMQEIYT